MNLFAPQSFSIIYTNFPTPPPSSFQIFKVDNVDVPGAPRSLQDQLDLFGHASLVLGEREREWESILFRPPPPPNLSLSHFLSSHSLLLSLSIHFLPFRTAWSRADQHGVCAS